MLRQATRRRWQWPQHCGAAHDALVPPPAWPLPPRPLPSSPYSTRHMHTTHASHSPTINLRSLSCPPPSLPPAHAPLSPPSQVTRDHKPDDEVEQARIVAAGGSVQQKTRMLPGCMCISPPREVPIGPHRVVPGGLAVARSMGDVLLKYVLPSCSVFILSRGLLVQNRFNYIQISVSFFSGRAIVLVPGFPTVLTLKNVCPSIVLAVV